MKLLIVNADDFGVTAGVNRSVMELHHAGAVTSATLMATGAAFNDAVSLARESPAPGIGCHVVLVDGEPVLPGREIHSLAPAGEAFRPALSAFVADLLRGRIREADIEREATAQIRRLQAAGVHVTHVDTHKHAHMFPRVLRPLLRAAVVCGVSAVRNPFEPDWALAATLKASPLRRWQVKLLRTQRRSFLNAVRDYGLATTDGAVGVLATGSLDQQTLASLLAAIPEGTWELVCHPGYDDAALQQVRTRLRASRQVEHDALLRTVPQAAPPDCKLGHFGDLAKVSC